MATALDGHKGLIVEDDLVDDDLFLGLSVTQSLEALGAETLGPASKRAPALRIAKRAELQGAALDFKLNGETTQDVATALIDRAIPVIMVTGYAAEDLPDTRRCLAHVTKPVDGQSLQQATVQGFKAR